MICVTITQTNEMSEIEIMNKNYRFILKAIHLIFVSSILSVIMPAINEDHDRYLYLQSFWSELTQTDGFEFKYPFEGDQRTLGLSDVVKASHGKPLDKSPTLSVWIKRSTDQYQIEYAALDAYFLLQVNAVVKETLSAMGKNSDAIISDFIKRNHHLAMLLKNNPSAIKKKNKRNKLPVMMSHYDIEEGLLNN